MSTIFVFGSNLAGFHGAGSAKEALKKHGAVWGQGVGLQGRSYAIPTKDRNLHALPLENIRLYVQDFLEFAARTWRVDPSIRFNVVKIGCGLAGYKEDQISPMFKNAPSNVHLPKGWHS